MFRDNPEALRAAAAYIERHREHPKDDVVFMRGEIAKLSRRQYERRAAAALVDPIV